MHPRSYPWPEVPALICAVFTAFAPNGSLHAQPAPAPQAQAPESGDSHPATPEATPSAAEQPAEIAPAYAPPPPAAIPPAPPLTEPIPDGTAPKAPVPPAFPPAIPSIDYGARLRTGLRLQNPDQPKSLDKVSGTVEADIYFSGQIHRMFKWLVSATLSYAAQPGTPSAVNWSILDVIARFEPLPEFNLFLGRMLVVADRYAPSGPWGMDEWFFPGFIPGIAPPALPKSGPQGRDVGVNAWGTFLEGHLKYYLGAYQLQDPNLRPLFTGRLQVSLLSPEPNFFQRTTYYGDKDLISVGVGGQYQAEGSLLVMPAAMPGMMGTTLTDDHTELNADLIVDKNIGNAGTLSVQGAGYWFGGDYRAFKSLYLAGVGFLFPQVIGIGKFRPSVRLQRAQSAAPGAGGSIVLDVQLSYVIMNWFARVHFGYRHSSVDVGGGAVAGNMLFLGIVLADP